MSPALTDYSPSARAKLDAYLLAALQSDFADYAARDPAEPLIAIGFTVRADATHSLQVIHKTLRDWLRRPPERLATAHLAGLDDGRPAYLTAEASLGTLHRLAHAVFVTEIELCASLAPVRGSPPRAVDRAKSPSAPPLRSANRKVLATIDHGCPFAHQALLDERGRTRVHALWDQDARPDFPAADNSTPTGYGYGRQVGRAELDSYMAQARSNNRVDEDACYRIARYSAVRGAVTHGSWVLGVLGSRWLSPSLSPDDQPAPDGDALDADLVFVQLPRAVPTAPDRGSVDLATLDGLRYIVDCAPDGADVAVVVDYGTEMGPHDGTSWFERAVDALVHEVDASRQVNLKVVFASGNSHDVDRHAVLFADATRASKRLRDAELRWWVPRGSDGPAFAELWFHEAAPKAVLELHLPGGAGRVLKLQLNKDGLAQWPAKGAPLAMAVSKRVQGQRLVMLRLAPTFALGDTPVAPAGAWSIQLTRESATACHQVHAYTCWGGQNPGLPQRLVASRFVAAEKSPTAKVTGDGSLLGSACGVTPLMAGGYQHWGTWARTLYSSGGAARGGHRAVTNPTTHQVGADWLAVTEQLPSLPGLLLPTTRSGAWSRARGTSFAAPQAARKLVAGVLHTVPAPRQGPPPGTVLKKRDEYHEPRIV